MAVTILPLDLGEPSRPFANTLANMQNFETLREGRTRNQFLPEALGLANQLSGLNVGLKQNELNYAPRMSAAELSYKNAGTKSLLGHLGIAQSAESRAKQQALQENNEIFRLMKMPGIAGQIGAEIYLKKLEANGQIPVPQQGQGTMEQPREEGMMTQQILGNAPINSPLPNQMGMSSGNILAQNVTPGIPAPQAALPYSELLHNTMQSNLEKQNAWAKYNERRTEGYSFNQLPTDEKKYAVAQLKGAQFSSTEAVKRLGKGESLEALMAEKGYEDPSQYPKPDYAATTAGLTLIQRRKQAEAELKAMNEVVTQWGKNYSKRFWGYSPLQIKNALQGKDKAEQARAVAFYMIGPDIASVRGRTLAGQVGVQMMENMAEKSLMRGRIIEAQTEPEVFERAQMLVDKVIRKGVRAAEKAGYSTRYEEPEEENEDEDLLGDQDFNEKGKAANNDPLGIR